jgi:isochorismate hydrolase
MNKYFLTPPSDNEIVLNNIIEQINKDSSSSTHEIASLSSSAKPGEASPEAKPKPHHEPSSMDKYFLTPQSNNEIVRNKLNLKKLKSIAKNWA